MITKIVNPVKEYLEAVKSVERSGIGTPERSYYPALQNLINDVAKQLGLKAHCVMELKNLGAGMPDGGIYRTRTAKEQRSEPLYGIKPEYGVIEVKPPSHNILKTAETAQVTDYWKSYRKVLVTNLREFVLVDDRGGKPNIVDSFSIADSIDEFRQACAHSDKIAKEKGARLIEFLKRTLLHSASIASPSDLAAILASYARDALDAIESADSKSVRAVKDALSEALGMKFQGESGEHLFRSSLVQTLFYGIFSAWVLWHKTNGKANKDAKFDWRLASEHLVIPILNKLYYELVERERLESLQLKSILDRVGDTLNRVDRVSFFAQFQPGKAVQYFYEPFLESYDPGLRREYGVWYTPPEIVEYMVERVDRVLRSELDVKLGLADPSVYVLDPCCGTGAYLVEVLRRIARTLREEGKGATVAEQVRRAATERVFGFEIMPAPYVISHLQINLELVETGVPITLKKGLQPAVFLTNALTGWEPPSEDGMKRPLIHELEEDLKAAAKVKRDTPILVIIGNPPYNAFAGMSPEEERGLVEVYKGPYIKGGKDMFGNHIPRDHKDRRYLLNTPESEGGWGIKKFNLDDLYIRFFRLAERRIAEMTGKGIVCFISNYSYTSEPSFVIMREHLLKSFNRIWIENMHGNRKITEYAPDGRTSQTVFAIKEFSTGIQQGVVISLLAKTKKGKKQAKVLYRNDIDDADAEVRRAHLLKTLRNTELKVFDSKYEEATPSRANRFSFRPLDISHEYIAWPRVVDLSLHHPYNGPVERRGGALFDIDIHLVEKRTKNFFDGSVSDAQISSLHPKLLMTNYEMKGSDSRKGLIAKHKYNSNNIAKYPYKVFDVRYCYLANIAPLFSRPSPDLIKTKLVGCNAYLITRDSSSNTPEGPAFYFSKFICDYSCISGCARHFPLYVLDSSENQQANLSEKSVEYLKAIGINSSEANMDSARAIWMHALAIGYSPLYLSGNADGIATGWPRIALPATADLLRKSAILGEQIATLLDTETSFSLGLTAEEKLLMTCICVPTLVKKDSKKKQMSVEDGDFDLKARWGYKIENDGVMPASGTLAERGYTKEEMNAIENAAPKYGLTSERLIALLGETTLDVYINENACWQNIPKRVWEYYIGGYQVIKKWLSYREFDILGRSLKADEVDYVSEMARRLARLRILEPRLDANYKAVKENAYDWPNG